MTTFAETLHKIERAEGREEGWKEGQKEALKEWHQIWTLKGEIKSIIMVRDGGHITDAIYQSLLEPAQKKLKELKDRAGKRHVHYV